MQTEQLSWLVYFNPRPREGSDDGRNGRDGAKGISIHAPVKGATLYI